MATEDAAVAIPPDLAEKIDMLHSDVENLQRELTQALEVWNTALADEKTQFEELLRHKELAWREQEEEWGRQSRAYEERLETLKSDFESRLRQSEQNAAHALAELDDAWQRDKLEWGPAAGDAWPDQRRQLEAKAQVLERELADKEAAWSKERETYEARLRDAATVPPPSAQPSPDTVSALQNQLMEFQTTVSALQNRAAQSDELVNACVQAIDYQISVLFDLVHHYAPREPGAFSDLDQP